MTQANFSYAPHNDFEAAPLSVSIFGDEDFLRQQIGEDLRTAGFRVGHGGRVDCLLSGEMTQLGDVVMLDCRAVDAQQMAALARLDMRLARSRTQLIVATSSAGLDPVFASFDQCDPQILVDASRVERIVAMGRIAAAGRGNHVREMSDDERLRLVRLSEQVDALAQRIGGVTSGASAPSYAASHGSQNVLNDPQLAWGKAPQEVEGAVLPDPHKVRQIIRHRHARSRFFDAGLFADPAWDMLLDLTAAHAEKRDVSVTSLCIAANVPATTALRWVKQMVSMELFERISDNHDKRRAFIRLSDKTVEAMARYFAYCEKGELYSI